MIEDEQNIEDLIPSKEEIERAFKSCNREQKLLIFALTNVLNIYQERINNVIEFCNGLLAYEQVIINDKTYKKHECDNEITNYIISISQGKIAFDKDIIKEEEVSYEK